MTLSHRFQSIKILSFSGVSASSVYDICIKPGGSEVVAAAGNRVLCLNAATGDVIESLKGWNGDCPEDKPA